MNGMAKKRGRGPDASEVSSFCAQVALILGSGISLYDGMEALSDAAKGSTEYELYKSVSDGVTQTGSLNEALRREGVWPGYMVEMVAVGERTGRLEDVMVGLSEYYEREGRVRRAISSAVTYPVVLGAMMLVVVLVMILLVMPVFRRVLNSMGVALTDTGKWMMQLGVNAGWVVFVLLGAVIVIALVCAVLMRTGAREATLRCLKSLFPPVRRLTKRLSASRVASVLSMMLSGGFRLEEALEMVPSVLPDTTAAAEVGQIRDKLNAGISFADAVSASSLFDPLHCRMIRMGVEAGREDQVMAKISQIYQEDVEEGISNLVSIIEPTLVALLSIVIGAVLLSVMLPMAGIISSIA